MKNVAKDRLDNDDQENSLEFAKQFKRKLRFDLGDTVFIKSDTKKKCPMTVAKILIFDEDDDYLLTWATSQKTIERQSFPDQVLTK
ncbi:MAG: hypothetical protein AB7U05_02600 [Mangrovibacterium sp.]